MSLLMFDRLSCIGQDCSALTSNHPKYGCLKAVKPLSLVLLEHEIRVLRARLERSAEFEKSMTSASVVQISSQLDLKINEYMKNTIALRKKS